MVGATGATILIVEDETGIADMLADRLAFHGYRTLKAEDGARALELVRDRDPDLALVDLYLPRVDGVSFIEGVRAAGYDMPVIVMSAGIEGPVLAARTQASCFLEKPFAFEDALFAIEAVLAGRITGPRPFQG